MNILFLSKDYYPNLIGGVGVYIDEASRLLAKMGHKTYIITAADETPLEYTENGVKVIRVKSKRYKFLDPLRHSLGGTIERLEYSLAVSRKIKELLKEVRIDIIESCEARAEGFWYRLFHNKPFLVVKLHTPETVAFKLDHTPATLDYHFIKLLEEFWISSANVRTGLSQAVVDLTNRHFSTSFKNIPKVANPIDMELFKPAVGQSYDSNYEILYAGRLEFRKGVHSLIRAFGYVQAVLPQARLTFVGSDCGMKPYLLSKVSKLSHPDKVRFVEHISRKQLIDYYQKSSICVVPSTWENYPYVCLEAMACSKAVIASDTGGLKDIVRNGENGILFPNGSSRQLSEAIIKLLKDARLREILGRNARKSIEENYAPEKIAKKTLDVYQQLINN